MADKSYKLTLSLSDGTILNAGTITAPQGPSGANGVTFTPSVSSAGVLSWTNNGGLTNPTPISIKGPKGDDAVITESDVAGWGFTKNKGTVTSVSVKMNGTTKGTVTSSGTIDLGTVLTSHQDISGKLDKTAYEVNKTINFGSSGVLYVGKFKVYDTNVTCEVTSTTSVTYSGKLVIATQNYVIKQMAVYGDTANIVTPNFFVKPSTTSDPYIEVYFKPSSYSKNVVHIYGSAIAAEPTNVCTNVSAVPSTATSKPTNALDITGSGGYSINAAGYIKGSWLQASATSNKGANTGKVCVFDDSGWVYYRTPSEILSEANGIPKSAFSLSGTVLTITL